LESDWIWNMVGFGMVGLESGGLESGRI